MLTTKCTTDKAENEEPKITQKPYETFTSKATSWNRGIKSIARELLE